MGVLTSKQALKRLSIKIGEYSSQYLTTLACLDQLKLAWKEYRAAKKEAWTLRKSFVEDKIARKAHDSNVTTETIMKMMVREQRSIQEGMIQDKSEAGTTNNQC